VCRSYSDLNFGVTFFGTQCSYATTWQEGQRRTMTMKTMTAVQWWC